VRHSLHPNDYKYTKRLHGRLLSSTALFGGFRDDFREIPRATLDQISDNDPSYVVWLADEGVLKIEREFLEAVRMDDMEAESEMRDIINEHVHDIY